MAPGLMFGFNWLTTVIWLLVIGLAISVIVLALAIQKGRDEDEH